VAVDSNRDGPDEISTNRHVHPAEAVAHRSSVFREHFIMKVMAVTRFLSSHAHLSRNARELRLDQTATPSETTVSRRLLIGGPLQRDCPASCHKLPRSCMALMLACHRFSWTERPAGRDAGCQQTPRRTRRTVERVENFADRSTKARGSEVHSTLSRGLDGALRLLGRTLRGR
jgi:hypothetical protein